ncbi:MAG: hypothetical protein PPP56_11455 [Longimonas sp.]|uniref:hypothetical protein n=1 Tax=Longimonas sp. TaxID=2039626 RepID=UPI0033571CEA
MQDPLVEDPLVQCLGPAVPSANKLVRDRNGQRWQLRSTLRPADSAKTAQTTRAVRSSGPAPRIPWHRPYLDPLRIAEELHAHRETLHTAFTHGWKTTIRKGRWTPHKPRTARQSETIIAQRGSDYPSFISVGRWRTGEISRRHKGSAVTVPWIIADIDGESPRASASYAKTLCRLLAQHGVDLSEIVVSYTGGRGFHVRIPHGIVGCPIYQDAGAATRLLIAFFDRLCEDRPDLRKHIDNSACRPTQMIRMIGSNRTRGGRCVAVDGTSFLQLDPLILFGHSDNQSYNGYVLPRPEDATYTPALKYLLLEEESITIAHTVYKQVEQLLGALSTSHRVKRQRSPSKKNRQTHSAIHVNNYCWKPHFSRPPPIPADAPHWIKYEAQNGDSYESQSVIDRLMYPVQEAEAWGEAVGRPYVGRNAACFVIGLYAWTYPEAALQRVQALLRGRDGEAMPSGDGAAPLHGKSIPHRASTPHGGAILHEGAYLIRKMTSSEAERAVRAIVHTWNRLVCRPTLPEREVDTTLRSARKYT